VKPDHSSSDSAGTKSRTRSSADMPTTKDPLACKPSPKPSIIKRKSNYRAKGCRLHSRHRQRVIEESLSVAEEGILRTDSLRLCQSMLGSGKLGLIVVQLRGDQVRAQNMQCDAHKPKLLFREPSCAWMTLLVGTSVSCQDCVSVSDRQVDESS